MSSTPKELFPVVDEEETVESEGEEYETEGESEYYEEEEGESEEGEYYDEEEGELEPSTPRIHKVTSQILESDPIEIVTLKKLFKEIDEDGDGEISVEELRKIFLSYGLTMDEKEVDKLVTEADKNRDGKIQYIEFREFIRENVPELLEPMEVKRKKLIKNMKVLFQTFDKNGDGSISMEELKIVLRKISSKSISDEDMEKLIRSVDVDGNGLIEFEEFQTMMKENRFILKLFDEFMRPSPLEYLKGFIGLPSCFRDSLLVQVKLQGINKTSTFTTPQVGDSGCSFIGTKVDDKGLLPIYPPTYELRLMEAIGIPLPSKTVLQRKVLMCLYEQNKFISNVYEVKAKKKESRDDYWNLGNERLIIRTTSNDANLFLYLELVIVIRVKDKLKHISCGWINIKIAQGLYLKTMFKDKRHNLTGGTIKHPESIDPKDISATRKDFVGNFLNAFVGKPIPSVQYVVSQIDKKKDNLKYGFLPPNILIHVKSVPVVEIFRKSIAKKLLRTSDPNEKNKPIIDPLYTILPKLIDKSEIWSVFVKRWEVITKKKKLNELEKVNLLRKHVLNFYPLLYCLNLPVNDFKEVGSALESFIENFSINPQSSIMEKGVYKPFDVRETLMDVF